MKDTNFLNLFWCIVWVVVLVCAIVGFFWKPAQLATVIIAAGFSGMFIYEYVRIKLMK